MPRNAANSFPIFSRTTDNAAVKTSMLSDRELSVRIRKGDVDAYKELFMRYYSVVYRFLCKVLGSGRDAEQAAEDIAQNAFMKIWTGRTELDERKSVKSLLYTMAHNEAVNLLKVRGRVVSDPPIEAHSTLPGPGSSLEYRQLEEDLMRRIDLLPPQRRKVFLLSRIQQKDRAAIAEELGISVRTVDKHLELAVRHLKHDLS